jgi:hypothetical protein
VIRYIQASESFLMARYMYQGWVEPQLESKKFGILTVKSIHRIDLKLRLLTLRLVW